MYEIRNLRFNGVEFDKMHSGYWNLNALTYTQEPKRAADGTIPDINNIETFYVPRLWVDFKMLTLAEYQELMAVINKPSFDIEYYDAELGQFVVKNFYLSPLERNELYNYGENILGVKNFNLEFIGTTNEPTSESSVFEITINTTTENFSFRLGEGYSATFAYYVNWGDGSEIEYVSKTNGATTTVGTYYTAHTYATAGTYKIQIFGVFPYIYMAPPYNLRIKSIDSWGISTIGNILGKNSFYADSYGCPNLTSLPKNNATNSLYYSIPEGAYQYCTGLKNIIIKSDVVGKNAFAYCTGIETVNFSVNTGFNVGLQLIKESAFQGCTGITSIILDDSYELNEIETFAFAGSGITTLTIYETYSIPTLGVSVFNGSGISASTGNIYVPTGSVAAYQSATNWSTFASRISAITNTVTLDGNGGTIAASANWTGSGSTVTKTVTYTSAVGTIPTASEIALTGYTFGGWNTESDGTGTTYTNATLYQVKGNLTLYAQWTITV